MKADKLTQIKLKIMAHPDNLEKTKQGIFPLFKVTPNSKIIIIGQAPGVKAEKSQTPWNDLSGDRLREWLGVTREVFYNFDLFGQLPMDFYYPGKGKSGDLPPRKSFAKLWHSQILENINPPKLIILVGSYAQNYYLKDKLSLTKRVQNFKNYLPKYFVLSHPSPLNLKWRRDNDWFEKEVIPYLQQLVKEILNF